MGVIPVTKPPGTKTQAAVKRTRFGLVTLIAGGQSSGGDEACNRWEETRKHPSSLPGGWGQRASKV